MNARAYRLPPSALLAALVALPVAAADYVYEGNLDDGGVPANGRYELHLTAYADARLGGPLAAPIVFPAVDVRDGRFRLAFALPEVGTDATWLELAIRADGDAQATSIPGRTKATAAPLIGACWSATGDAGSNPATHFLGTTDAQPLVLRTHNARSLRIEPSAELLGGSPITANVIAGSSVNGVTTGVRGATVAGGGYDDSIPALTRNWVTDHYGAIGGGSANLAGNDAAPTNDASAATVAGGIVNRAVAAEATVGGGRANRAGAVSATVAGGLMNAANSDASAVGGGSGNTASGIYSVVAGGLANCAGGAYSSAAGRNAKVRPGTSSGLAGEGCAGVATSGSAGDQGTFVWADSQASALTSTGPDQFLVRAQGGVAINSNTPTAGAALTVAGHVSIPGTGQLLFGSSTRQMLNLFGTNFGSGVQLNTHYFRSGTGFAWFQGGTHNDGENNPGAGGSVLMTLTPNAIAPALTYSGRARAQNFENVSDRAVKTDFRAIDAAAILRQVVRLPLASWRYVDAPGERHLGPVAQDFLAVFGLGSSERTISTVDSAGVALAAIQGLNAKLERENRRLARRVERLDADNDALRSELAALRTLVESRLGASEAASR